MSGELLVRSVLIGAGATAVIDVWAAVLRRFGIPSLSLAMLGRWVGHLPRGRWFHDPIASSPPVRGELLIGWCAHYAIGISFATLLVAGAGLAWARAPTPLPAIGVGLVTVVAPLLVLQPALGAGVASTRTPTPLWSSGKSIVTHLVFGVGLFLAARLVAWLLPGDGP